MLTIFLYYTLIKINIRLLCKAHTYIQHRSYKFNYSNAVKFLKNSKKRILSKSPVKCPVKSLPAGTRDYNDKQSQMSYLVYKMKTQDTVLMHNSPLVDNVYHHPKNNFDAVFSQGETSVIYSGCGLQHSLQLKLICSNGEILFYTLFFYTLFFYIKKVILYTNCFLHEQVAFFTLIFFQMKKYNFFTHFFK